MPPGCPPEEVDAVVFVIGDAQRIAAAGAHILGMLTRAMRHRPQQPRLAVLIPPRSLGTTTAAAVSLTAAHYLLAAAATTS